jgi:hypothetical protein
LFEKVCKAAAAGLRRVGDLNDCHAPYYKVVLSS